MDVKNKIRKINDCLRDAINDADNHQLDVKMEACIAGLDYEDVMILYYFLRKYVGDFDEEDIFSMYLPDSRETDNHYNVMAMLDALDSFISK